MHLEQGRSRDADAEGEVDFGGEAILIATPQITNEAIAWKLKSTRVQLA